MFCTLKWLYIIIKLLCAVILHRHSLDSFVIGQSVWLLLIIFWIFVSLGIYITRRNTGPCGWLYKICVWGYSTLLLPTVSYLSDVSTHMVIPNVRPHRDGLQSPGLITGVYNQQGKPQNRWKRCIWFWITFHIIVLQSKIHICVESTNQFEIDDWDIHIFRNVINYTTCLEDSQWHCQNYCD